MQLLGLIIVGFHITDQLLISQNYWGSGICPSSQINRLEHDLSKSGSVSSSGEGRMMPSLLGALERPNLNHWTTPNMYQRLYK
jgi:hypothetical protein